MSKPLNGKIALVTGASRGIGRATARRLAADGAFVLVHYSASQRDADQLITEIKDAGGSATATQADLATSAGIEKLATDVRAIVTGRGGKLDILINNAGVAEFVGFADTTEAAFDRIFAVNAKAPYFLTQKLVDLVPNDGRILFTTTMATDIYFAGVPAYAASKGAIVTLIRHLAAELGPKGIRVNGVAPGAIETDMATFLATDDGKAMVKSIQALQEIGQPEDIARVFAFLAGPDGRWVTGDVIHAGAGTKL